MKKILKSKSGFTLVEVIISMVLLAIIIAFMSSILVTSMNTAVKANDLAELTSLVNNIGAEITDNLSQSTANADVTENTIKIKINSSIVYYKMENSILQRKFYSNKFDDDNDSEIFNDVFHEKYYKNKKLNVTYTVKYVEEIKKEKPTYTITIDVFEKDGIKKMFTSVFTSRPLILNQ